MDLKNLKKLFAEHGCRTVFIKRLSPNDNSKNQVYLSGSFDLLNVFPISQITTDSSGEWKRERFKASVKFSWIGQDGNLYAAPNSQLILYPKYPEVRLSGFLIGCENPPSELMTQRLADRILFLGVVKDGTILGYVDYPDSQISIEFQGLRGQEAYGVFTVLRLLSDAQNYREKLLTELRRIHDLKWITSKRLDAERNILPCLSPNCGGYTLEAELGITPNGYSEPDYLGWEVKQFSVDNFNKIESKVVTLMTPEPTDGFYKTSGTEAFIRKYGYADKRGRADRVNFGGIYKVGIPTEITKLRMELIGFDPVTGKIRSAAGRIVLLDTKDNEAASWSFSSLLLHWNRKHNQACYVPSMSQKTPVRKYLYGYKVILGEHTDFQFFLKQMHLGNIYYDPAIKLENASAGVRKIKRRSQFRIKSGNLPTLYKSNELVDVRI